jgi:hypothetical protein
MSYPCHMCERSHSYLCSVTPLTSLVMSHSAPLAVFMLWQPACPQFRNLQRKFQTRASILQRHLLFVSARQLHLQQRGAPISTELSELAEV